MVTVIIIGRDQSLTLAAAIGSAAPLPVIYFDAGSTDNSRQIAADLGATVLSDDAVRGGSATRNHAAARAQTDYCLCLAPDDVLDAQSLELILQTLRQVRPASACLEIREHDRPVHHRAQRLWRKDIRWVGRCHEYLDTLEILDIPRAFITHHAGPWHARPSDPDGVIKALMADIAENGNEPRWWYYLAREYHNAGHWVAAIPLLKKRIAMRGFLSEVADAHLLLAHCFEAMGQKSIARQEAMNALVILPQFAEALRYLGQLAETPEDAAQWNRLAEQATNQDVLFIRN